MSTYDRREKTASPDLQSLAAAKSGWLKNLCIIIGNEGQNYNRHMKPKLEPIGWGRIGVEFKGENQSDMPASSYAIIALGDDLVSARCTYKVVGGGSSDVVYTLDVEESPAKFIEYVAKFLVGYTP